VPALCSGHFPLTPGSTVLVEASGRVRLWNRASRDSPPANLLCRCRATKKDASTVRLNSKRFAKVHIKGVAAILVAQHGKRNAGAVAVLCLYRCILRLSRVRRERQMKSARERCCRAIWAPGFCWLLPISGLIVNCEMSASLWSLPLTWPVTPFAQTDSAPRTVVVLGEAADSSAVWPNAIRLMMSEGAAEDPIYSSFAAGSTVRKS
jgi:hypothetical protein